MHNWSVYLWICHKPLLYKELCKGIKKKIRSKTKKFSFDLSLKLSVIKWCEQQAIGTEEAVQKITGSKMEYSFYQKFHDFITAGMNSEVFSRKVGGAADLELLYHLTHYLQAKRVIETGVAFGWSSLAILLSLQERDGAKLISTDLPYGITGSEKIVGSVVPEKLRSQWTLLNQPDKEGLPKAFEQLPEVDLCHYDSDKTYEARMWAYPELWKSLRQEGIFISDDVQDNFAFKDFCVSIGKKPIIVKFAHNQLCGTKYVGVLIKN